VIGWDRQLHRARRGQQSGQVLGLAGELLADRRDLRGHTLRLERCDQATQSRPEIDGAEIERCWLDLKQHYLVNMTFTEQRAPHDDSQPSDRSVYRDHQAPMSTSFDQAA
jgi:hypothetical protein